MTSWIERYRTAPSVGELAESVGVLFEGELEGCGDGGVVEAAGAFFCRDGGAGFAATFGCAFGGGAGAGFFTAAFCTGCFFDAGSVPP